MKIEIGRSIKNLRIQNNISQDTLSAHLGVTPQAISRWESGICYPDIEILPAIASFFSVTTDELLGIKQLEREIRLQQIHDDIIKKWIVDVQNDDMIIEARGYSKAFPADEMIQTYLASLLTMKCLRTGDMDLKLAKEAEKLLKTLIDNATVNDYESMHRRNINIERLASLYAVCFKDREKLDSTLEMLSSLLTCRESVASRVYGMIGDNSYKKAWTMNLMHYLYIALTNEAIYNVSENPSEWERQIEILEHVQRMLRIIYGDITDYYLDSGTIYRYLSNYKILQGKYDDALGCLEKMCDYYIRANDIIRHINPDNNSWNIPYNFASIVNGYNLTKLSTARELLFEKMAHQQYDPIRKNARFELITKRIKEIEY